MSLLHLPFELHVTITDFILIGHGYETVDSPQYLLVNEAGLLICLISINVRIPLRKFHKYFI